MVPNATAASESATSARRRRRNDCTASATPDRRIKAAHLLGAVEAQRERAPTGLVLVSQRLAVAPIHSCTRPPSMRSTRASRDPTNVTRHVGSDPISARSVSAETRAVVSRAGGTTRRPSAAHSMGAGGMKRRTKSGPGIVNWSPMSCAQPRRSRPARRSPAARCPARRRARRRHPSRRSPPARGTPTERRCGARPARAPSAAASRAASAPRRGDAHRAHPLAATSAAASTTRVSVMRSSTGPLQYLGARARAWP